jgi:NitT/TauT family transport system substrate-binding protein
MKTQYARQFSRREFLGGLTLAGTAGLLGLQPGSVAAEPPPETTRLRIGQTAAICVPHLYLAQEFLPSEGFTDVQFVQIPGQLFVKPIVAGEVDFSVNFAGPLIIRVDAGDPIMLVAGGHVGCFELVGTDQVRAIRDLKGRTVAVSEMGGPDHVFLASMIAYVGLDPNKDVNWLTSPRPESVRLLTEKKIDAFMAFPPFAQELRAKQIGHVVVNSVMDRPWSQYFCCMVYTHGEFVRKHPVATKRVLRAILKAGDLCTRDPERAAQFLVDKGFTPRYDYALQTLQDIPYAKWREYDPEDTIRFYALRLHEAGMIKGSPQRIIAQGTNWRILNELKKELKA